MNVDVPINIRILVQALKGGVLLMFSVRDGSTACISSFSKNSITSVKGGLEMEEDDKTKDC